MASPSLPNLADLVDTDGPLEMPSVADLVDTDAPVSAPDVTALEDTEPPEPLEIIGPQKEVLGPPMPPPPGPAGIDALDLARRFPAGIAESTFDSAAGFMKVAGDAATIPQRLAIDARRVMQTSALDDAIAGMGTPEGTAAYQTYLRRRKAANEKAGSLAAQPNALSGPIETARELSERSKGDYGVDTRRDSQFLSQAASGAGSFVPALASGPLAPVTIAGMMGEGGRKDAEAHDATPEQQNQAFYSNAAVGALSEFVLGVPALLRSVKAAKMPLDTFKRMAKSVAAQVLKSSAREGTQEGLEQAAQNVIASEIAQYDKERSAMEGVGRAAAVGAFIGAPVGGVTQTAANIDEKVKARSILDGTDEQVNEMEAAMADEATPPYVRAAAEKAVTQMRRDAEVVLGMAEPFNEQQAGQEDADNAITRNVGELWRRQYPIEEIAKELEIPVQDAGRRLSLYEEAAAKTPPPVNEEFFNEDGSPKPEFTYQAPEQADPDSRRWRTTEMGVEEVVDRETGIARTPDGPVRVTEEGVVPLTPVEQVSQRSLGRDISPTTPAVEPAQPTPVAETAPQPPAAQPSMAPNVEVETTPAATPAAQQPAEEAPAPDQPVTVEGEVPGKSYTFQMPPQQVQAGNQIVMVDVAAFDPASAVGASTTQLADGQTIETPQVEVDEEGVVTFQGGAEQYAALRDRGVKVIPMAMSAESAENAFFNQFTTKKFDNARDGQDISSWERPADPDRPRPGNENMELTSHFPFKGRFPHGAWPQGGETDTLVANLPTEQADLSRIELAALDKNTPLQMLVNRQIAEHYRDNPADTPVILVEGHGQLFPLEGSHRLVGAKMRGDSTINAIVIRESDLKTLKETGKVRSAPVEQAPAPEEAAPEPSEGQDTAQPPTEPPAPPVETAAPEPSSPGSPTGIRNAIVDQERAKMGLPPRMKPIARKWETVWSRAMQMIDEDPMTAPNLITDLVNSRRLPNDLENAILAHEAAVRRHAYDKALIAQNEAKTEVDEMDAAARVMRARDAYAAIAAVADATGTELARAFNARKMMVDEEMSLSKMQAETRAIVNGGKKLSPEQETELAAAYDRIANLERELAQQEQEIEAARNQAVVDEIAKEEAPTQKKQKEEDSKLLKYLDEKAAEARKKLRGKIFKVGSSPDLSAIGDMAWIGASYIAHGARSLTAFTARLVQEFGEGIRSLAPQIYEAAKADVQKARRETNKPTVDEVVKKAEATDGLTKELVSDVVRAHVRSGLKEHIPLMEATAASLKPKFPDVDVLQVQQVFSDYGNVRYPSKTQLATDLRRHRAIALLYAKLDDALKKQAPKRTGYQRDETDPEIRELQRQLNAALKEANIQVTDPATQLTTSLNAIKTRLRHRMEELRDAIAKRHPITRNNGTTQYDPEATALKEQVDKLQEQYDAIFRDPVAEEQAAVEAALRLATESIERYDEMMRTDNLGPNKKAPKYTPTAELEDAMMLRDAMWSAVLELRKAKVPKTPIEETRTERAITSMEKAIAALDQRLLNNDLSTKPQKATRPEVQRLAELREVRDGMLRNLREARAEKRKATTEEKKEQRRIEKQVELLNKDIARLEGRINAGDFSSKPRPVNRPEVQQVAEARTIRDALRDAFNNLKKAQLDPRTYEERVLDRDKKSLNTRIRNLQEKIRIGDFTEPVKREPLRDPTGEKERLQVELMKEKAAYARGLAAARRARENNAMKSLRFMGNFANWFRALNSAFDFGMVLRQGYRDFTRAFTSPSHALTVLKRIGPTWDALKSADGQIRALRELEKRDNYAYYKFGDLDIMSADAPADVNRVEEEFQSEWVEKTPGISHSARIFNVWMSIARADLFDAWAATMNDTGVITKEEAIIIANGVNIGTGRGYVGRGKIRQATPFLNTIFYATRLYAARIQELTLYPIWAGLITGRAKGAGQARKVVAKEYVRSFIGATIMNTMIVMAYKAALAASGDDDELEISHWNPLSKDIFSSKFAKIRIGARTYVDMLPGHAQFITFFSRVLGGMRENGKGEAVSIRGNDVGWGQQDTDSVIGQFYDSKRNPINAAIHDAIRQQHYGGREWTPTSAVLNLAPMSGTQMAEILMEHPNLVGAMLAVQANAGAGVSVWNDKQKAKKKDAPTDATSLRRQLRKDLGIPSSRQLRKEIMGD